MRRVLLALAILVSLVFMGICANADTVDKDRGYISVSQSATKEIVPNQAEISFGIETSDKSIQEASEDNKKISNKVYASLKAMLGSEDSIKTSNYSVYPQYIYTKDNKKILDKYVVSNTVIVKTKKINLVSKLIDTATAQGVTSVAGLQFSASDCDDSCDDMLAELTKKSYNKADIVAKSINSQITGIKSINVSCSSENNPTPMYGMMSRSMDAASAVSTPIESGKLKIYANVDASFYVK